jgi:uncharacterized repeat protein (TIGR03943 family)
MRSLIPRLSAVRNAVVLLLWGAGVLWLAAGGRLSTYLHPSLQPFTTAAGCLLLLLCVFSIMGLAVMRRSTADACGCDHHHLGEDHHHDVGVPWLLFKTLVLLFPVAVLLSGNADRFTATTVSNRGVVQDLTKLPSANAAAVKGARSASATLQTSPEVPSDRSSGPMPLQVIDMLYALHMPSYREEFEGKEVEMIGQFVPLTTGNPKGDRFQLIRMFITCCAADAKPMGVTVQCGTPPHLSEMEWIRVTGRPTFPMDGGKRTAILEAKEVKPCEAPSDPFVY